MQFSADQWLYKLNQKPPSTLGVFLQIARGGWWGQKHFRLKKAQHFILSEDKCWFFGKMERKRERVLPHQKLRFWKNANTLLLHLVTLIDIVSNDMNSTQAHGTVFSLKSLSNKQPL